MAKNLVAVFAMTVAAAATPLACGDDESPTDDAKGNAGAPATGGGTGQPAGGVGGEETGGETGTTGGASGTNGTGGNAGASGKAGAAGSATGGAGGASGVAGESGASGASDGGIGGAPGGGEGGEGWHDESVERAKRICEKIEALNCGDHSMCVETIRVLGFGYPHCGPYAERLQICLDEKATIEDFACSYGRPFPIYGEGANPCDPEITSATNHYC